MTLTQALTPIAVIGVGLYFLLRNKRLIANAGLRDGMFLRDLGLIVVTGVGAWWGMS